MLAAPDLLDAASADDLRQAERLRAVWSPDLVAAAGEQAELRARATTKFTRAADMLLTRAGLEQASGETAAQHRAARFAGADGMVIDLCCGIGGDLVALSAVADVTGVDVDEVHAVCARHNAGVYDADAAVVVADVQDVRVHSAAAVFADPARRRGDRRGGYAPPLEWCLGMPARRVAVKTAPGLDRRLVPSGWETEFVAEGRDLKEAVLWSPSWATARARGTVLPAGVSLTADPGTAAAEVRPPGAYLLDPSPAVTRAGAVADLAAAVGAWQVDARIAFLSADTAAATPFGRWWRVEASLPFGVKPLAAELRRLDVGSIDIRRRGLAGDVDDLRRRLRPQGARRATVVITRVVDRPWSFVCTAVDPS